MDGESSAVDAYYRVYERLIDIGGNELHQDGDLMNELSKLHAAAVKWDRLAKDSLERGVRKDE